MAPPTRRIPCADDQGDAPLTSAQRRVLLMNELAGEVTVFNLMVGVRLGAEVDADVIRTRIAEVTARNDSMRMTVQMDGGTPRLRVREEVVHDLAVVDLIGQADQDEMAGRTVKELGASRFDLVDGPLWRFLLIRLDGDTIIAMAVHHLVADATSLGLVGMQLATGEPPVPKPVTYVDYAAWEARQLEGGADPAFDADLTYWLGRLQDVPAGLSLRADRPSTPDPDYAGATIHRVLPAPVVRALSDVAGREGATPFAAMLGVWSLLLNRMADQDDFLVGVPTSRRDDAELRNLVGMLINILPMRIQLRRGETFRQFLRRTGGQVATDLGHATVPFEQLVQRLRRPGQRGSRALVEVGFNALQEEVQLFASGGALSEGTKTAATVTPTGSQLDLTLHVVWAADGSADLQLEYASARFDDSTARAILQHVESMAESLAAAPDEPLEGLPFLTPDALEATVRLGDGGMALLGDTLCDLIRAQARSRPDAVAIEDGTTRLCYAELDRRAGAVAARLRTEQVAAGDVVGLSAPRSVDYAVGALAAWRLGAAFMPLDPNLPPSRRLQMVHASGMAALLTSGDDCPDLEIDCPVVSIEGVSGSGADADRTEDQRAPTGADVAYVMFTSGSTGVPKPVMVPHHAIANRAAWSAKAQRLDHEDRVLAKTRIGFDASVLEWMLPLSLGATVVVAPAGVEQDPAGLVAALAASRATVFQTVPSVMRVLLQQPGWPARDQIRTIWVAGEPLDAETVAAVRRRSAASIWNTYGPTECAVDVTAHQVLDHGASAAHLPSGPIPIGQPIPGVQAYVLDGEGRLCPPGLVGELCVGGVCLAIGYASSGARSAERFVPDPHGASGARVYRTGDLVRADADGTLHYLGRTDDQVKINGVRVEPLDVNAALAQCPGVRQSFVTSWRDGSGRTRLVGYVTTDPTCSENDLRRSVATRLPEVMIPSLFIVLESFPLNANGKLDRSALPAPTEAAHRPQFEPPMTEEEQAVAEAWRNALDLETKIGRHDDFFALGGHSLLLTEVQQQVERSLGRDVALRTLFLATTVESLAAGLAERDEEVHAIRPLPEGATVGLSPSQTRWWLLNQLHPGAADLVVPTVVPLAAPVRVEAVAAAVQTLQARHQILRTTYASDGGVPRQVMRSDSRIPLEAEECEIADVSDLVLEWLAEPFDLENGPVWRVRLFRFPDGSGALVVATHHIATDGWSAALVRDEILALLRAEDSAAGLPVTEPVIQYADYVAWQERALGESLLAQQQDRWEAELRDLPLFDLPAALHRPEIHDPVAARETFVLPARVVRSLGDLAARHNATPFMALTTVLAATLHRASGHTDIPIGTPVAGRPVPEVQQTLGCFINTVVLRADLDGRPSFWTALGRIRRAALFAFAHQDLPVERLIDALVPNRDPSRHPLYTVQLDLQDLARSGDTYEDEAVDLPAFVRQDLNFTLRELEDGSIQGIVRYPVALFEAGTIRRLLDHLVKVAEEAVEHPDAPIAELDLDLGDRPAQPDWGTEARTDGAGLDELLLRWPGPALRQQEQLAGRVLSWQQRLDTADHQRGGALAVPITDDVELVAACAAAVARGLAVHDGSIDLADPPAAQLVSGAGVVVTNAGWVLTAAGVSQQLRNSTQLNVADALRAVLDGSADGGWEVVRTDGGTSTDVGLVGELCRRGPAIPVARLRDPTTTARMLIPDCDPARPGQRVLRTGASALVTSERPVVVPPQAVVPSVAVDLKGDDPDSEPQTLVETRLIEIWSDLLDLSPERVGTRQSFFALGGTSLSAVQLVAAVNDAFAVEITLAMVFEAPTVAALGEAIELQVMAEIDALTDEEVSAALAQNVSSNPGHPNARPQEEE